jgi:PD-(D/E)XK nuclease family transposase
MGALGVEQPGGERFAFERQGAVLDLFGILHPGPIERLLPTPSSSTAWAPTDGGGRPRRGPGHARRAAAAGGKLRPMRRTPVFGDPKTDFVFNVEELEKRVVYNVAKAYTNQLGVGFAYPELDDVIGITICNFELWPHKQAPHVPMLSRWRMQEQESGVKGLPHLQFVFLELPKYAAGHDPKTHVDKWAYFFREAGNLMAIPEALREPPILDALEGARTARFNREEWDAYIAASMAIQNELGALSLARKEGRDEGRAEGEARALLTVLRGRGIAVPDAARERILAEKDPARLERWLERAGTSATVAEIFDDPS